MKLSGRRIVLGVAGGIAAYKAAFLLRRLKEEGAEVRVVITNTTSHFVGNQTFSALSEHPVIETLWGNSGSPSPHTDLARWGELMVICPATATTIFRLSHGVANDALSATALAATIPMVIAPAMHTEMWESPATQRNIRQLAADGLEIVGPVSGSLAGGDSGMGRMADPEEILSVVVSLLSSSALCGKEVLVTAGGTREPMDPVRYVGNRSSGKMGHAVAEEARRRGAKVTLVTTSPISSHIGIRRLQVENAAEMQTAVTTHSSEVVIMAAAVADFRPKTSSSHKLSRSDNLSTMELEPTPDILGGLSRSSQRPQVLVGFAAETGSLKRARQKAKEKGVDLMVANDVTLPGSGFGTDTNAVTLLWPDGREQAWPQLSKTEVATRLCQEIEEMLTSDHQNSAANTLKDNQSKPIQPVTSVTSEPVGANR